LTATSSVPDAATLALPAISLVASFCSSTELAILAAISSIDSIVVAIAWIASTAWAVSVWIAATCPAISSVARPVWVAGF